MFVENVVFDAWHPRATGRFWEDLLGTEQLTDEEGGYETRYAVPGGPELDLCFQQVGEPVTGSARLHLRLQGDRAGGPGEDPEGNEAVVAAATRTSEGHDAPFVEIVALDLEVADVARELEFWAWLTGWDHDPWRGRCAATPHRSGAAAAPGRGVGPQGGQEPDPPRSAARGRRRRRGAGRGHRGPRRLRVPSRLGRPAVAALP